MRPTFSFQTLRLAAAMSAALATATPADAADRATRPALTAQQQAQFEAALLSFRTQRYSAAYGRLMRLADAGHTPSAQLALVMFRYSRTLFDAEWDATPEQLRRWQALAGAAGCSS